MRKYLPIVLPLMTLLLGGCASPLPLVYHYHPSKASIAVTVTQTIDCDKDGKHLIVTTAPTVITTFSSDRSRTFAFDTSSLQSSLADRELTFNWYDDVRLKSINHSACQIARLEKS